MTTVRTITGREFRISGNESKRTFTIRTDGGSKYRTTPFIREEWEQARRFWTGNDWQEFLSRTNDYYVVR